MLLLMIVACLVGALLARRFKAFALVPATGFLLAAVAVGGGMAGKSGRWIAVAMVVAATFLQLGYLGGSFLWSRTKTLVKTDSDSIAPQAPDPLAFKSTQEESRGLMAAEPSRGVHRAARSGTADVA